MLDTLITNKNRVKLLLRFFLNPETKAYLRGLEEEFGDPIDRTYLKSLTEKATSLIKRKINCTTLPGIEEKDFLKENRDALLVWEK